MRGEVWVADRGERRERGQGRWGATLDDGGCYVMGATVKIWEAMGRQC